MARALFRNRMATAIWIFMAIWMTFLCADDLGRLFRDGPPEGHSVATIARSRVLSGR